MNPGFVLKFVCNNTDSCSNISIIYLFDIWTTPSLDTHNKLTNIKNPKSLILGSQRAQISLLGSVSSASAHARVLEQVADHIHCPWHKSLGHVFFCAVGWDNFVPEHSFSFCNLSRGLVSWRVTEVLCSNGNEAWVVIIYKFY